MARTASKSPGDAAGNPASMMSTPSSTSVGHLEFFVDGHRCAGRLLAISQRGVKDDDSRLIGASYIIHRHRSVSRLAGDRDRPALLQPGHHLSQLRADLFVSLP